MTGDCSTCEFSIGGMCMEGIAGQRFRDSSDFGPCPVWVVRGDKWKNDADRYAALRPWPFPVIRR